MSDPIHIISLGAGVQSSTMSLMAAHGEITPMPKCAIFADTQAEPASVYKWLDWLEKQLPFPVVRVSAGNLTQSAITPRMSKKTGLPYLKPSLPVFVLGENGSRGIMLRQCTDIFKLTPLKRSILGQLEKGQTAVVWIGISTDEAMRMKDSNHSRIHHRWPLIQYGMSRNDCLKWMATYYYQTPPRSACVYCPYHSNREWAKLKRNDPESFQKAVEFEKNLQSVVKKMPRLSGTPFLHPDRKPLSEVDFSTEEERGQLNMFNNECEGMCGV